MEFLPIIPHRLRVEAVCKRWRRLSRMEVPVTELEFSQVVIELIVQQENLCMFRAYRMQKKHIFNILKHCTSLKIMELMDSRSLIEVCGSSLRKVVFTEAMSMDSQVFRDLATHSAALDKLTISNCNNVRLHDVETLTEAMWTSLRWLDLSSCRGISLFPSSTTLRHLEVLMLDRTKINDDGLRAIACVAPSLRYLSLQDCRAISDDRLAAIASCSISEGCTNLELVDLKGTPVTDISIMALEAQCPRLQLVRVDSCRSVSRKMRRKCHERVLRILDGGRLSECERIFAGRKRSEMVDQNKSNSESDNDRDDDDDYVIQVRQTGTSYRRRR
ncbi:unnamed protein product [Peronospora belbahrii]|uniref:F-box/LRR-repeat protein 15-like leucin rich repeat domain-containing protein n=1 Tax=Peronospora belbahrii TaxID=622444 RepID=A0ABN8CRU4_9STRA|nr:unnamed protein product [Peronospora belbahrii]